MLGSSISENGNGRGITDTGRRWPLQAGAALLVLLSTGPLADPPSVRSAGASDGDAAGQETEGELRNSRPSAEALARAVLRNLEERDREGLEELLITREEHRDLLWEHLPEAEVYEFGYVRHLSERNSRNALSQAFSRYGGRSFELVEISFDESERERYEHFTLHRKATLRVRDTTTGKVGQLPILDVFVEWKGKEWKLLDYEE
jgi:hypothetical protein